ncbi:uncharacterized protein LOC131997922 [Stomoxys calcitrans]|uniref:uncharacterized protein LOC131997922 n=1 Tax=Stomoxys calcitrans TaxID=35570 RepID=UPI0027E26B1C|nr:uncharacterized protein LOC131997922 [Stomoxys calcitrans]
MPDTEPTNNTSDGGNSKNLLPYMTKIASMLKQLGMLKKSLTTAQLSEYDEADLSVRLDYVEQIGASFEEAQSALEEMVTAEMESEERMKFTALYLDVKAKLTRQMNSIRRLESNPRSSTVRQFSVDGGPFSENSSSTRKTRLPEIQLPKFGGAYADWPNFFSLFSTIVDSSAELSDLEKFHHLRSSLTGAALDTISSLELNERNYMEAVKLLKNRFDNKLLNFQTHIKAIFSLKAVEVSPAIGLRQLSDKFNSHLRAMQTIASRDQIADGLLVYLAATKMDRDSQIKWEESLAVNELPSWQSMSSFLEQRCRMLENLENSVVCAGSIQQNNKKQSFKNRHVHVASGSSSPLCAFCDSMDHYIVNCPPFSNLSPSLRFKEAKRLKLCLNCLRKGHVLKKCNSGSCRQCSSKHHTMLHMDQTPSAQPSVVVEPSISQSVLVSSADSSGRSATTGGTVLLATAIVLAKNKFGNFVPCRAILDSASQLNMIANRFAKTLGLNCNRVSATVYGIGDGSMLVEKSVDLVVKSCHSDFTTSFAAMVVPSITDYKPKINLDASNWNMPKNIQLADPAFNKPDHIDMLIGAELFFNLMSVGQIKIGVNLPVLQKTLFGWVVAGGSFQPCKSWSLAVSYSELEEEEEKLSTVVKSFWEIETNFVYDESRSDNELYCENHFLTNFVRLPSGSYSVRLPQIESRGVSSLGGSYQRALQRLMSLERKFRRSPEIKAQYTTFMREYATLSHMSLISPQVPESKYYLPHHCVHKLDSTSTKLRVVFDGSAKTATGLSLNDILHSGPTIQPKLFNTLVRYRFFKVALSGDICKMYRCVRVSHPDDYLQCILWRENEADDIKTYKLNTVTYGTKPAAFLAIRAMHQLAIDEEENFPLGSKVVRRDFYVDDMLSGGNTIAEVEEIRHQVTALLKKGEFLIRKWCSNDPDALRDVPAEDCETLLKFHDGTDVTKTLGLTWDPQSDNFIFSFTPIDDWKVVTKRSILSSIARLYDPLGLIGPVITKAKMFMQHLWKLNLQWDESLPQSLHSLWIEYISKFDLMHRFTFPRHVSMASASLQIHGFCDASLAAYGACVYVRSQFNSVIKSELLCSKSRVAPLKTLTVPKLELSAACLLAELIDTVVKSLDFHCEIHCWSDSMVVLSWLRELPSNFNVFVANRISRIQSYGTRITWHYVPTKLNPADILSRGATPGELLPSSLWKGGPNFLLNEASNWPDTASYVDDLPERRRHVLLTTSLTDLSIQCKYRNSFLKMQRIFAYVSKFVYSKLSAHTEVLTPDDIRAGTRLLVKNIQLVHFSEEYKALKSDKEIASSSKLYSLAPIIDEFGLIRVGGRLQNSTLDFDARHPIILPKKHPFTASMVMHFHHKLLHAGAQCLLAAIRQQFWPIGGRKLIASIISKCVRCFRMKPKLLQNVMGNLPSDRVRPNRAFHTTGIDFCGPFFYKSEVKSRPPVKCYICIFICFSTKATHLEVVQDLSTPSFLCSLRRFVATRGKPKTIWSDNASNFVGAKNELDELKQMFSRQSHLNAIHDQCLDDGIDWKFIPPRSPHFGGLWEAAVKSAKFHFYRAVGLNKLTFDELRTLVCQISAILNSRPLCPLSEDPEDLDVLTPGHFLVGGPLISIPEPNMSWINFGRLNSWQKVSELQQIFWRKWSTSYLTLLQERSKWQAQSDNISVGAMVVIKDENLPPLKWQMGRVEETIKGEDGIVRVVNVRTSSGIFKRAITKLAVLPISESVEAPRPSTGGGC